MIDPKRDWFDHRNWVLDPDHVRNMMRDGMSERTIKMSGAYTVKDEQEKMEITSRYGRSRRRNREFLGRLLVFPNPLIFCEQHSRTDVDKPKYIAPEDSCSPPMVIPVQGAFTKHNQRFLRAQNGDYYETRLTRLEVAKAAERDLDINGYANFLSELGFAAGPAREAAEIVFANSTMSHLYEAMEDNSADIEITEGQKKAYKMFQSYKEVLEADDKEFMRLLKQDMSSDEIRNLATSRRQRPNKLFICSPGVWQPVKAWKNMTGAEKLDVMELASQRGNAQPPAGKPPFNPTNKYCMVPSWLNMVDWRNRKIIITYDLDAARNINVAHSVTCLAQAFMDANPGASFHYRIITPVKGKICKGADEFIVGNGNLAFWDGLEVRKVAANVSWKELSSQDGNFIEYLAKKAEGATVFNTPKSEQPL